MKNYRFNLCRSHLIPPLSHFSGLLLKWLNVCNCAGKACNTTCMQYYMHAMLHAYNKKGADAYDR